MRVQPSRRRWRPRCWPCSISGAGVRPDIAFAFHCDLDESSLTEPMHTMFFRVFAQEGVSNAVRHGRPRHVSLTLADRRRRPLFGHNR